MTVGMKCLNVQMQLKQKLGCHVVFRGKRHSSSDFGIRKTSYNFFFFFFKYYSIVTDC